MSLGFGVLALGPRLWGLGFGVSAPGGFRGINIGVINVINVGLVLGVKNSGIFGVIHLTVVLLFSSLHRCQMPNPRFFLIFFSFVIWYIRVGPLGSKIGSNQLVRSVGPIGSRIRTHRVQD